MPRSKILRDIKIRKCLKEYCELFLKQYQEQIEDYYAAYKFIHQGTFDGILIRLELQQKTRHAEVEQLDTKNKFQNESYVILSGEQSDFVKKIQQLRCFQLKTLAALCEKRKDENFESKFYVEYMELYHRMMPGDTFEIFLKRYDEILKEEIRTLQEQL